MEHPIYLLRFNDIDDRERNNVFHTIQINIIPHFRN